MIGGNKSIKDAFVINTGEFHNILAGTPCLIVQDKEKNEDGDERHYSHGIVEGSPLIPDEDDEEYDEDDEYEDDAPQPVAMAVATAAPYPTASSRKYYGRNSKVILPISANSSDMNRRKISMSGAGRFAIMTDDSKKDTSLLDRASLIELAPMSSGQVDKNKHLSDKIISLFDIKSIITDNELLSVTSVNVENATDPVCNLIGSLIKTFPHVFTLFCKTKKVDTRKKVKNEYDLRLAVTISNVANHMPMLEQFNGVFLHICVIDMARTKLMSGLETIFETTLLFSDLERAAFVDGDRILYSTNIKTMYNHINKNIRSLKTLGRHNK